MPTQHYGQGLSRSDGEDARDLQSWREELQKHDAAKLQAQIVISNEEMKSADGMQQPRAQPRARPKKVRMHVVLYGSVDNQRRAGGQTH